MTLVEYFTDPVLRAPTIGSMLMCLSSSLVGVLVFIRKRSLLGEALSHAAYPGVVLSALVMALFFPFSEEMISIGILIGAFVTSLAGLFAIDLLERKFKIKSDAALCLILSLFFGVGVLIASRIQTSHALWFKQTQVFLFGQTATITDAHLWIYGILSICIVVALTLFYRLIEMTNFDPIYAKTLDAPVRKVDGLLFILLVLAIVIGIRSVGVVLMSAMLIAPAVAARQFTDKLYLFLLLSGTIGMLSGFFGNYLSIEGSEALAKYFDNAKLSLPTGPMIVLFASALSLFSLFFSPKNGLFSRYIRLKKFSYCCRKENFLKIFWKFGEESVITLREIALIENTTIFSTHLLLISLLRKGYIESTGYHLYRLSDLGKKEAARIVRLHRLWEAYLVFMKQGKEKVHISAEEMEHVLTPEIEKELAYLLQDPQRDPHRQPIPQGEKK